MVMRNIIGCMSGTSMDAIDASLVRIDGAGLSMRATPTRFASAPLGDLAGRLRAFASQKPMTAGQIAALSREFSIAHIVAILEAAGNDRIDMIAVHGQTVFHAPPLSWQLLTPALIAHAIQAPLVCDLRAADLAAGGQGAPITPLADWVMFRDAAESRVILNLGGFANFTYLPPADDALAASTIEKISGGDICACNQLLDGLAARLLNRSFDQDGVAAASGEAISELVCEFAAGLAVGTAGRSLGTAQEPGNLIPRIVEKWSGENRPADLLASAVMAVAASIARALPQCDRVLLAGGGAKNRTLCCQLSKLCAAGVAGAGALGVRPEEREAVAMAVLGALCQDRTPITLPQITGLTSVAPIAGQWVFPGSRSAR